MSYFAALLARTGSAWQAEEVSLDDCESVGDIGDLLRDVHGDVRLVVVEQDDEYAAIVRLDDDLDEPRAFLSDAHAADSYAVAGFIAEDLEAVGASSAGADDVQVVGAAVSAAEDSDDSDDDSDVVEIVGHTHESVPMGDADVVADLGVDAAELLALCAHEGTLPIDLLVTVCEKAGCGPVFDDLRG